MSLGLLEQEADNRCKKLRYKDYQLASRPSIIHRDDSVDTGLNVNIRCGLEEIDTVKGFGLQMEQRGVHAWWREAMGYTGRDDRS